MTHVTHESIPPVYQRDSKILILGSVPSVKSREAGFYYMHPQNRFWPILSAIFEEEIIDKKSFCLNHKIALWDVVFSCDIHGSSDATIKNVVPCDISKLIKKSNITTIFTAGKTAHNLYQKYGKESVGIEDICLPSTSPANCRITWENMISEWKKIKTFL